MNKKIKRILAVLLAATMVLSLCSCGYSDDDDVKQAADKTQVGYNKAEILDYFKSVTQMVIDGDNGAKPAVSYSFSQGTGSCECENKYIKAAYKTVSKLVCQGFGASTEYGKDCTDIFALKGQKVACKLEATDIKSAEIVDFNQDGETSYKIVIKLYGESNPTQNSSRFGKAYDIYNVFGDNEKYGSITTKKGVIDELNKGASSLMSIEDYNAQYTDGTITAQIEKKNDHLTNVTYQRNVKVSTVVTGKGNIASVGAEDLSFDYNSQETFDVNWDNPDTSVVE